MNHSGAHTNVRRGPFLICGARIFSEGALFFPEKTDDLFSRRSSLHLAKQRALVIGLFSLQMVQAIQVFCSHLVEIQKVRSPSFRYRNFKHLCRIIGMGLTKNIKPGLYSIRIRYVIYRVGQLK